METDWVDFKVVKQTVSMQMVIDHYGVKMRRSGNELRGKCPIHKGEGTDTLHVNTEKNIFQCFSCKAKGNVLDFVAAIEQCKVRDAALKLASWYSLPRIPSSAPNSEPATARKQERAQEKEVGESSEANRPLGFRLKDIDFSHAYLKGRGIERETAEYFGAGFFSGKGSMHDRVVIPIENQTGELVAYVGRAIDNAEPKYKLPSGFGKSQVIYNLARAREDAGGGTVVLVEGFFDCMKVTQAEFPCVALMGSSMSAKQEALLASNFERVVIMLDGDEAGRNAAPEIAARLAKHLFARIVDVGNHQQPDQLVTEELKRLVSDLF